MRFWNRATSASVGDKKETQVKSSMTNRQVSNPLRVFGQRAPFSNPMDESVYGLSPDPSLGREVRNPEVEPVDQTAGNSNDTLLSTASGASGDGVVADFSSINVNSPPTYAQITSAFGTPASVGGGFIGVIDDAGFHTAVWLCVSDGALNWHVEALTKRAP